MNLVIGIVVVIMFVGIIAFVIYVLCFIKKVDKHNRLMHEFIVTESGERIMMIAPRKHVVSAIQSLNYLRLPSIDTIAMPGEEQTDPNANDPYQINEIRNRPDLSRLKFNRDSKISNLSEGQSFNQYAKADSMGGNMVTDHNGQPAYMQMDTNNLIVSDNHMNLVSANTLNDDYMLNSANTLNSVNTLNRQMSSGGIGRTGTVVFDTPFTGENLVPTESQRRSYRIPGDQIKTYTPKYKKSKLFTRSIK